MNKAEVHSPFSGKAATEVWGYRDGQNIFRCPDTGALFFDRTILTHQAYQDYYPYLRDFDAPRNKWEIAIRRGKYRCQLSQMRRYTSGSEFLDVGAGPGYLCRVAADEGWRAVGIEVSTEAVRHGVECWGVKYTALDEAEDSSFDAITCHHVLEHVEAPIEFLGALRTKLKPNGLLVLHVPHQQPLSFWLRDKWRSAFNPHGDTWCRLYGNIHISGFDKRSLRRTVESAGFETYFVRTTGMWSRYYDPFFFGNYWRDRNWNQMVRKAVRHALDKVGVAFGKGDWVIGYFRKTDLPRSVSQKAASGPLSVESPIAAG